MIGVQSVENKDCSPLQPTTALIFYASGHVSRHRIQPQYSTWTLGAGELLSENGIGAAKGALSRQQRHLRGNARQTLKLIPRNVIAYTEDTLVWVCEGQKRHYWYQGNSIGIAMYPTLLMAAQRNQLQVFALADNIVESDTVLYHAPLMNISDYGSLCLGTATPPKDVSFKSIQSWENVLFNSNFTHVSHSATLVLSGKTNVTDNLLLRFWRDLSKKKGDIFPTDKLSATNQTLSTFLASL